MSDKKVKNNQLYKKRLQNRDKSASLIINYILDEWLIYKRRPAIFEKREINTLEYLTIGSL